MPSNRSLSTDVTVAPGKHAATPARSMNVSHVVPTGAGTVNWCCSSTGSGSRRREDGPAREDGGEVLAVGTVAVEVRRWVGALRRLDAAASRTASSVAVFPTSACSTDVARNGVDPMLVNPIRASAMVPPSTRTVAATATIDHWCFTRTNFS